MIQTTKTSALVSTNTNTLSITDHLTLPNDSVFHWWPTDEALISNAIENLPKNHAELTPTYTTKPIDISVAGHKISAEDFYNINPNNTEICTATETSLTSKTLQINFITPPQPTQTALEQLALTPLNVGDGVLKYDIPLPLTLVYTAEFDHALHFGDIISSPAIQFIGQSLETIQIN